MHGFAGNKQIVKQNVKVHKKPMNFISSKMRKKKMFSVNDNRTVRFTVA